MPVLQHADAAGERWLTVNEAAAELRVNAATIRRHFRAGRIDGLRVGRQIRISADEVRPLRTSQRGAHPTTNRLR